MRRSLRRFQKRHISDALGLETVINPHKRQKQRKGYFMQEIPVFVTPDGNVRSNGKGKASVVRKVFGVWKHENPSYKYVCSKFILHEK